MDSIAAISSSLEPPAAISRPRRLLSAAALALITFVAYFPALSAGYIWDDNRYVVDNINLRSIHGLEQIWFEIGAVPQYYPVTHTTFWIEYHLWKLHPLGYHLDNVLLHAASAIVLWAILRGLGVPGAWVIAAIFAVHPIQTESVAWVTERKNVLSGFFFFLSLFTYPSPRLLPRGSPTATRYRLSLTLFVLALLSKSVTSSLPAVILLLIWWRHGRITRRDVWPLIPFFILGLAMGTLTGWMERNVVGAVGPDFTFSHLQRCVIAGHAIWFYAVKLLWPHPLIFIYSYWNLDLANRPWLLLLPLSVILAIASLWLLRRRMGRGPLTAALLFVGMLFPALGFVNVYPMRYSFVADHFQYLAGIPLAALIVGIAIRVLRRSGNFHIFAYAISILLLLGLSILTWRQCRIYYDLLSLWRDTLAKNPNSYMAHSNYADALQAQGQSDEAEAEYNRALALKPNDVNTLDTLAMIHVNRGDYDQAIALFHRSLQALPDSLPPSILRHRYEPYYDLGVAYTKMARAIQNSAEIESARAKAQESYLKALQYFPNDESSLENLGVLMNDEGKPDQALHYFRDAVAAHPDSSRAHQYLAIALHAAGDTAGADAEYQIALQLAAKASEK